MKKETNVVFSVTADIERFLGSYIVIRRRVPTSLVDQTRRLVMVIDVWPTSDYRFKDWPLLS